MNMKMEVMCEQHRNLTTDPSNELKKCFSHLVAIYDEVERGVEGGEEVGEGDHGVRPRRRPRGRHVHLCGENRKGKCHEGHDASM